MKNITLIIERYENYFKTHKAVFCLYLIGGILCAFVFFYFFSNLMPYVTRVQKNEYQNRYYSMLFSNNEEFDETKLSSLKDYAIEDIVLAFNCDVNQISTEKQKSDSGDISGQISIITSKTGNYILTNASGRVNFNEEELSGEKNVIIFPYNSPIWGENPEHVYIGGEKFDVIGSALQDDIVVPFNLFKKFNFPVSKIDIVLENVLPLEKSEQFKALLTDFFPNAIFQSDPSKYIAYEAKEIPVMLFLLCLVYAVFVILFAFLMRYIIENSSYENSILLMVGATKSKVCFILLLQNICSCILEWGIVFVLYRTLFYTFFDKINIYRDAVLNNVDCLIILVLMIIVSTIVMLPFYIKIVNKTTKETISEYSY